MERCFSLPVKALYEEGVGDKQHVETVAKSVSLCLVIGIFLALGL